MSKENNNAAATEEPARISKNAKLTPGDVITYLKAPAVSEIAKTSAPLPPIRNHSHVVINVINEEGDPMAYIKPGPLSEAEAKYCHGIYWNGSPASAFIWQAQIKFLEIIRATTEGVEIEQEEDDLFHMIIRLKDDYADLKNNRKNEVPWSEEEYEQMCLQIIKDAKYGKWFHTFDIVVINRYSAFTEGCLTMTMKTKR